MSLKSNYYLDVSPFIDKMSRHGLLTATEERGLIRSAQKGDKSAEARLVSMNVRLILTLIKKFQGRGLESDDLFQAGCIGFTRAIRKFDLRRKDQPRLSTYATWWVKALVQRAVVDTGRTIRLPSQVSAAYNRIKRTARTSPIYGEDHAAFGASSAPVRFAAMTETVSFDQPVTGTAGISDDATLQDILSSSEPDSESKLQDAEKKGAIAACLRRLRAIEREVVWARFYRELTLDAVADDLFRRRITKTRVSRERVRQIQTKAMKKLKIILAEAGLNQE